MTEADLTAIEERNTRAIGFNHHALTDIPRLLSEVRSLQALERTAWADYRACAAERDKLALELHSARQMVTDTHAALERSERLWQEDERLGRAREDALEARVAELEALFAELLDYHAEGDTPDLRKWSGPAKAAANHRARQAHAALSAREPVEGRDFDRMPGVAND